MLGAAWHSSWRCLAAQFRHRCRLQSSEELLFCSICMSVGFAFDRRPAACWVKHPPLRSRGYYHLDRWTTFGHMAVVMSVNVAAATSCTTRYLLISTSLETLEPRVAIIVTIAVALACLTWLRCSTTRATKIQQRYRPKSIPHCCSC